MQTSSKDTLYHSLCICMLFIELTNSIYFLLCIKETKSATMNIFFEKSIFFLNHL